MSQTTGSTGYGTRDNAGTTTTAARRRVSTETKASVKTTELIAFVVVGLAMMIASQIVDGFDAQHAWFYLTLLTIGYMVSRGLAKSGSRDFYDDDYDRNSR
jgi:hypothetical protein